VDARAARGEGPIKIRYALRERGVERTLIDEALSGGERDWLELVERARAKRFGAARPADFRERARQARFLERRGFAAEHIRRALGSEVEG
jgi:regulatory protein